MEQLSRRLKKMEQQLCIGDKPVVFGYTDDKGVEQKVEMPSTDFDKLLREIRAESKGLPVRERIAV
ncbi:MAG: hypothetical protein WC454_06485 [Phycisphaerae bacterium]|jgi:hypothetical protein